MVGGKDASHSFCLLLDQPIAVVGGEQIVFLVAATDVEVLTAGIQCPSLGVFILVMRSATVPVVDLALVGADPLWTARCATLSLDEGQSLTIWVVRAAVLVEPHSW
jgi:hypothetical protein